MGKFREKLIKNGVSNLKEFGYEHVDENNILIDIVYKGFFKSMLKDNLGYSKELDDELNNLLKEIEEDGI